MSFMTKASHSPYKQTCTTVTAFQIELFAMCFFYTGINFAFDLSSVFVSG